MNNEKLNKILKLFALSIVLGIVVGCKSKTPDTPTHHESGSLTLITDEIVSECMENKEYEEGKEVLEMKKNLDAFYCEWVNYDDIKNRNYNNIEYEIGDLQIAVAAYNEYNDESAMDVEVDWICQYDSCTQEQHDAIDAYVYWFGYCQKGHYEGTIKEYRDRIGKAYNEMLIKYDFPTNTSYDTLTPAQFKEVQNYMADPENYQVDTSLWE